MKSVQKGRDHHVRNLTINEQGETTSWQTDSKHTDEHTAFKISKFFIIPPIEIFETTRKQTNKAPALPANG